MKSQQKATMKDVAERAHVSIATVSHVLNGTATISPATVERVKDAIQSLDYVPNRNARGLRGRRSGLIGVLVPNLNNNFYTLISSRIIDLAYHEGYSVTIFSYEYDEDKERTALERLDEQQADAVVILNGLNDERLLRRFILKGMRILVADRHLDGEPISCITFDHEPAMSDLIAHFLRQGCRRIAYFSETPELQNIRDRFEAFCAAMRKFDLEIRPDDLIFSHDVQLNIMRNGYQEMLGIIEKWGRQDLPDALVCSSDLLAIAAMKAIQDSGLRVPGDIAVSGIDDIHWASFVSPALTTIRQDCGELSRIIWQQLRKILNDEEYEPLIRLRQELIVRQSSQGHLPRS